MVEQQKKIYVRVLLSRASGGTRATSGVARIWCEEEHETKRK